MIGRINSVRDVAERHLCCGCGACAYFDPERIRMVDDAGSGRRPIVNGGAVAPTHDPAALAVCPGIHLERTFDRRDPALITELTDAWGPVYEVWEGHAADPEIRFAGSSGGAASALALFCIEQLGFHGVLHIAARPDVPYLNHTVLSTTRAEILARTGSRYAPASPCDGLQMVVEAPGPCVFIGKPCDVVAVQKARRLRPELDAKLGLTIAFFCAGVPSTQGTLDLLKSVGVEDPSCITALRYRGHGWPGRWAVRWRGEADRPREASLSYEESWAFLVRYKQWRCRICPDHTGEFADLAVGDPWYRSVQPGEYGSSLILARTPHGRALLRDAARYLTLVRSAPNLLEASQPGFPAGRGAVWGRLLGMALCGLHRPRYTGFSLFAGWRRALHLGAKIRATLGTLRRIWKLRLYRRRPVGSADLRAGCSVAVGVAEHVS